MDHLFATFPENSVRDLATAVVITLGVLLIVAVAAAVARRKLRNAGSTETRFDDFLAELVHRTRLSLLTLPAIYLGARSLVLTPQLSSMVDNLARLSLIVQCGFWMGGVIDFFIERSQRRRLESDPAAVTTFRAFRFAALVVIWTVALLVALANFGIDVTALVTGLGIGGVAIALALQNILGDLFASLSIVLDKPFVVGDVIAVSGEIGVVDQIGLKTTRIQSLSGEQLVFSNGELLKNVIHNYKRMHERRVVFRIGVVYQTPAEKLERIPVMAREIINGGPSSRFDRGHFVAFGDSSYDFEFVYYVASADYLVYMDTQQRINLGLVRAFAAENIEFAYPTRTLFIERSGQDTH